MKRPLGYTLLEMLLTLAMSSILIGGLGVTVSRIFAANATSRDHLHTVTNLGQLSEQFRRDAHAATSAQIESSAENAGTEKLTFDLDAGADDGKKVVYSLTPGGVERREFLGTSLLRNELFLISGLTPLAWKLDENHREVSLAIARMANQASDDRSDGGSFSILAVLKNAKLQSPQ